MATLASLTLRIADKITPVLRSTTTSIGSKTLLSDTHIRRVGDYEGGVVWFLSGDNIGLSREIKTQPTNQLTFATVTEIVASGIRYAAADKNVRRDILQNAVNEALRKVQPRLGENLALVIDSEVDTYTLPTGVSDLVLVEESTATKAPWGFEPLSHWKEKEGELRFSHDYRPTNTDHKIRLTYREPFAETTNETTALDITAAQEEAVYWRALIEVIAPLRGLRPDDQKLADIFQEAQVEWQRRSKPAPQRGMIPADW